MEKVSYEERKAVSRLLRDHHGVFYKFWELVEPVFDDKIDTACVGIDANNKNLCFKINKDFWKALSDEQKKFIVAHEAYHLINQHGRRANGQFDEAKNVTLDIPINEGLVKYFGFKRKDIDPDSHYCWLDTVFPDGDAEPNRSFEYYYNLLKKSGRLVPQLSFNDHSNLPHGEAENGFLDKLVESLDENEAKSIGTIVERQKVAEEMNKAEKGEGKEGEGKGKNPGGQMAGKGTAGIISKIEKKFIKKKPKWETIIRRYSRKRVEKEFDVNHWVMKDRRLALLNPTFMLPHDINTDDKQRDRKKQSIFCFLDVSGSCWAMKGRFYNAFESIPKNIVVKLFSFDDVAYELNAKERQIRGGGGTSFTCIEEKIQEVIKRDNLQYPKNVFVLTDGFANTVKPQCPKNWVFLLTTDYTDCIPEQSARYDLRDFE